MNRFRVFFLMLLVLFVSSCSFLESGWGEHLRNADLPHVCNIAPFTIGQVSYLPQGINPTPLITYHDEWGDKTEVRIHFKYYWADSEDLALEIVQGYYKYSRGDFPSQETVPVLQKRLTDWLASQSLTTSMPGQVISDTKRYQEDTVESWAVEINQPSELTSNLVAWHTDKVTYIVYSRLSTEETLAVAKSMTLIEDCERLVEGQ